MILNKVRNEGNSIFIKSNPITGIIALTSFVDNASGEYGQIYFTKKFRYTTNGIIYSDWIDLSVQNVLGITVSSNDVFILELQYRRNPVGEQSLAVSQATINVSNAGQTETNLFKNSIFYTFFGNGDVEVLNWMINVLEKLFEKGLIPNYIDRYNSENKPDDFIEFWGSVCKFFAYYVIYARKYQTFYNNQILLAEYLRERGLTVSPTNTLQQLQVMMAKYHREIARRGTVHIVDHTGLNAALFDGELLRLIQYNNYDEFLFNLNKTEHHGWNIGNGSPLYRSVTVHDNFNKFYEPQSEPADIAKYPLVNSGNVSIVTDGNKKVLRLINGGGIDSSTNAVSAMIPVDEYMDYEFSFFVKKAGTGNDLTIGFKAFDKDHNPVDLVSRKDATTKNYYLLNKDLSVRYDKYVYFRAFLYNKLKPFNEADDLNIKLADNVHFVIPVIRTAGTETRLYNIRFLPMALPYSKGFIQVNNFIDAFVKNNNKELNIRDVKHFIKKYLIPYSSHIRLIETDKAGDYTLEEGIISSTVNAQLPTVTTAVPANVMGTTAVLGGNVTSDGGAAVTERGIVWALTSSPTITDNKVANGRGLGTFSQTVTGLPKNSTVYIRAFAINAKGVAYGAVQQIATVGTVNVVSLLRKTPASPTNANSVQFELILSGFVTGINAANFEIVISGGAGYNTLANPSITSITGSGTTYLITVNTATGDGLLGLNMANDTGVSRNIENIKYTGEIFLIDKTKPIAAISYPKPPMLSNNTSATFYFSATDTGGSGIKELSVATDGGAFSVATSPVTMQGLTTGPHNFQVKARDNAGNESDVVSYDFKTDVDRPVVVSSKRFNPPEQIQTAIKQVIFEVVFSESVSGVDIADFALTVTGNITAVIAAITQISPAVYRVLVNSFSKAAGTIRLDVAASGTGIADDLGNALNGGYTTGEIYEIDNTDPVVVDNFFVENQATVTGSIMTVTPNNLYTLNQSSGTFPVQNSQIIQGRHEQAENVSITVYVQTAANKLLFLLINNTATQILVVTSTQMNYAFDGISFTADDEVKIVLKNPLR